MRYRILSIASGTLLAFGAITPAAAEPIVVNPAFIRGPATFSVGDVALFPGLGRQVINPAFGTGTVPNDVHALSVNSGFGTPAVADLFLASPNAAFPNGTNVDVAGPGAHQFPPTMGSGNTLGLVPGDNLNSISFGKDGTGLLPTILLWSVDPDAFGARGDIVLQAFLDQAAGDVFATGLFSGFGAPESPLTQQALMNRPSNLLVAQQSAFGLEIAQNKNLFRPTQDLEDDLDALEVSPPGGAFFFSLDRFSPSAQLGAGLPFCGLVCPSDILFSPGGANFGIFKPHPLLGLLPQDEVDALALSVLANQALFSLDPDSPTLALLGLSPADVFITSFNGTFALYALHDDLGLLPTDNLNALDTLAVPEPSLLFLLGIGGVCVAARWRAGNRGFSIARVKRGARIATLALVVAVAAIVTLRIVYAQVQVPAGALAQNEPSIAVNPIIPNQVIVGYNTDNLASFSGFGFSPGFPPGTILLPPPFQATGDPALAFNSAGQAFYATLGSAFKDTVSGIFVARQAGAGFGPGVPVAISTDPRAFLDKEFIAVDRILPGARFPAGSRDNVYVSFSRFSAGREDIQFSRSTDLGLSYSRAATISETVNRALVNFSRRGSVPSASRGNRVFVAWRELPNLAAPVGTLTLQGSSDGGRSFPLGMPAPAANINPHTPHRGPVGNGSAMELVTFPTLAIDNTGGQFDGRIYLAWNDTRAGDLDIMFTRSVGPAPAQCTFNTPPCTVPFAAPVRINTLAETVANDQFMPWMAVNSLGQIAVVFYSKLNNVDDTARIDAVCSSDGGVTWTPDFTVSGAQVIRTNTPGFAGQIRFGEYIGLSAVGPVFHSAWTADGGPPPNQDIFTTSFTCGQGGTIVPVVPPKDITPDQVIPTTPASDLAAAAFQSSDAVVRPEIIKVNLVTQTLAASVALPDTPVTDVVITPDGLVAVNVDASGFNIINLATNALTRLPLGSTSAVTEIAVTPNGLHALVGVAGVIDRREGPIGGGQELVIINLSTAARTSVPLASMPSSGITVTPDSQKALIAAGLGVLIIDIASATATNVALADVPNTGIVLTPDGSRALVAAGARIYIIDVATSSASFVDLASKAATDITVTPNGARAVLGTRTDVSIVNIAAETRISVPLASPPLTGVDVTPNSATAVIRDTAGAHLINLLTAADTLVPLPAALGPFTNPVITPNGSRVLLGDGSNVTIIRFAAPLSPLTVPIGEPAVISIAVTPNSQRAVFGTATRVIVLNTTSGAITAFALGTDGPTQTGASITTAGNRAVLLTTKGMEVVNLGTLTKAFVDRSPRTPMLNFLSDDGQPPLPPLAERGRRSVLDGR